MFKIGDKVRRIGCSSRLKVGEVYTVRDIGTRCIKLVGCSDTYYKNNFELVASDLEIELRLCESRRDIVAGRVGVLKQEEKSLEKRIQELQQAIKDRVKPKGRVKIGDSLTYPLWLICASGCIAEHNGSCWTQDHIAMGNLFYDKESAERAVHNRKQRVLRGEDV